jgi:hypothetical protein
LKSGSLPAKADTKKQREFFETVLRPLMERAREGAVSLLFMDASHFVMGCDFLGYIYGKTRRFVKTYSGRLRYNVLGALDFCTKRVTAVANDTYITATEVCGLFDKIAASYAGKEIHVVLDNAKYQKCGATIWKAAELGIHLVFIPPYSPNLNLVERFWKFVKTRLRTRYYDDFGIFNKTVDDIIGSAGNSNKTVIDKLIGEKVQLFDDLITVNENTFKKGLSPAS